MATNTANDTTLSYFQILGKCEETDDSSYTRLRDGKEETVSKIQLSLVVPGMQDRVRVELPQEVAPSTDVMSQWELDAYAKVKGYARRLVKISIATCTPSRASTVRPGHGLCSVWGSCHKGCGLPRHTD